MNKQLTPRKIARAMQVSEASLKRWCDRGLIPSVRTAGGHRRIELGAVLKFLRESGRPLPTPELLGLPSAVGKGTQVVSGAAREATAALAAGDDERFGSLIYSLYLAGHEIAEIGDEVIAGAFAQLGDRWQHGALAVYEERRACEVVLRVIHELRRALPHPEAKAPLAIGGTPSGDPYSLPNALVELALREAGWHTMNLGCGLPVATIADAVTDLRPALLWLSISGTAVAEEILDGAAKLVAATRSRDVHIVVGGRAATDSVLAVLPGAKTVASLRELSGIARTMFTQQQTPADSR